MQRKKSKLQKMIVTNTLPQIDNIKKDDVFNYNLELKNLDILFKKIENDN